MTSTAGRLLLDAKGEVVATSSDGAFVVQRGQAVDVYACQGEPTSLPIGDPDDTPGVWYAVSPAGAHVALVSKEGSIQLWDVASRRLCWQAEPGRSIEDVQELSFSSAHSWGPPVFAGPDLLVSHHNGALGLWEVQTGRSRGLIVDPIFTLTRQSFPLEDGEIAVRCGSNTPGIANTALMLVSLELRRVTALLPPHAGGGIGAMRKGRLLVTAGTAAVRVMEEQRWRLLPVPGSIEVLAASPQGDRIAVGTEQGGVVVWALAEDRLFSLESGRASAIVHVRCDGSGVHAIDEQGGAYAWSTPLEGGEAAGSTWVEEPEQAWSLALVPLGAGDIGAARSVLEPLSSGGAPARYRLAAAYVASLGASETSAGFFRRVEDLGLSLRSDWGRSLLLGLVSDLVDAEVTYLAEDLVLSWLETRPRGSETEEQGVELGLAIAMMLSEAGDDDRADGLLRSMSKELPHSRRLGEELADLGGPDDENGREI